MNSFTIESKSMDIWSSILYLPAIELVKLVMLVIKLWTWLWGLPLSQRKYSIKANIVIRSPNNESCLLNSFPSRYDLEHPSSVPDNGTISWVKLPWRLGLFPRIRSLGVSEWDISWSDTLSTSWTHTWTTSKLRCHDVWRLQIARKSIGFRASTHFTIQFTWSASLLL